MFHEKPGVSRFTDDIKDASFNLLLDVSLEESVSYRILTRVFKTQMTVACVIKSLTFQASRMTERNGLLISFLMSLLKKA